MLSEPGSRGARGARVVDSTAGLRVAVVDARGRRLADGGLGRWLRRLAPKRVRGSVTIAVVSNANGRALNRIYRGLDYATDVLSFPAEPHGVVRGIKPYERAISKHELGDIVIAKGVARAQAQQAGHSEFTEWRILAVHGLLHLIGYDHEHPADDGAMARIERRWRKRGGLPTGTIDRAAVDCGDAAREEPPG